MKEVNESEQHPPQLKPANRGKECSQICLGLFFFFFFESERIEKSFQTGCIPLQFLN